MDVSAIDKRRKILYCLCLCGTHTHIDLDLNIPINVYRHTSRAFKRKPVCPTAFEALFAQKYFSSQFNELIPFHMNAFRFNGEMCIQRGRILVHTHTHNVLATGELKKPRWMRCTRLNAMLLCYALNLFWNFSVKTRRYMLQFPSIIHHGFGFEWLYNIVPNKTWLSLSHTRNPLQPIYIPETK